ncbi:hypothetical protein EV144_101437 [Flavobacterium sp. 270]|uniref:hypothetical protein n=1 Tax=Flavobacterium sp. 270 TaxID=2512114 RepID=UPI001066A86C|nr:hypothetical protein [Flavobacterium sp. 270]TDW51760.1 hypothetical protein EV144_101437 [Flavobacterium sp. 270]
MNKIICALFIIGISLHGYAQDELDNKFKAIPAKEPKTKEVIPPKEIAPKVNPPAVVEAPDPLKISPEELFKDTNIYKPDANVEGIFYRRNQYLGGYRTKSFTSTIRFRDAAFVDGDKIKIYLNDKVIEPEVSLDGKFKEYKITLAPGMNKIDFEALNEGFASPNTAQYEVYDDKGAVIASSQWNVGTGYKAAILLLKE